MSTLFCVGERGKILHRSSGGVWSDHSPAELGINDKFWSVWGLSDSEVYAVGKNTSTGAFLFYRWDGSSWAPWSNPPTVWSICTPIGIFGISSSLIWVLAEAFGSGVSRIYQWDGDSWTAIFTTDQYRHGIWAAAADELYACGASGYDPPSLFKYSSGTAWISDLSVNRYPLFNLCLSNGLLFSSEDSNYVWRGEFDVMSRDAVGTIVFKNDLQTHGGNGAWSIDGKCWLPSVESSYLRVAYYDGSAWGIETLSASNYGAYRAITGGDASNVIIVAGNGSALCNAFVFGGAAWTSESTGVSDFRPMGAWMPFTPTIHDPPNPPSTTYDIQSARGDNRAFFFLHIEGFPYLWTTDEKATDYWTPPSGFSFRPGLQLTPASDDAEFVYSKNLDIFAGIEDPDSVDFSICDELLCSLLAIKRHETNQNRAYLVTNNIEAGSDADIEVDRAMTDAPSDGGTVYVGNQTITYTSRDGNVFSGVSRGRYAILDDDIEEVEWKPYTDWDELVNVPLRMTTFPQRIEGRVLTVWRNYRHPDTGVPLRKSESNVRFRGRITAYGQSVASGFNFHATSIITDLDQSIMSRAPTRRVKGYHIASAKNYNSPDTDYTNDLYFTIAEQTFWMNENDPDSSSSSAEAIDAINVRGKDKYSKTIKITGQTAFANADDLITALNLALKDAWNAGTTDAPWFCSRGKDGRIVVGYSPVGYRYISGYYVANKIELIPKGTYTYYEAFGGIRGFIKNSYAWMALGLCDNADGSYSEVMSYDEATYRSNFALWTNESLYSSYVIANSQYQPVQISGNDEASMAFFMLDGPTRIPTDGEGEEFIETLPDGGGFLINAVDRIIYRVAQITTYGSLENFELVDGSEDYRFPIASANPPDDRYFSVPESTRAEDTPRIKQAYCPTGRLRMGVVQLDQDGNEVPYYITKYGVNYTMLQLMLSTGTSSYNSTYYDILPVGWGLSIPAEYVNVESFEALYDEYPAEALSRKWIFSDPESFRDFLDAEAKTLGIIITIQNGKITAIPSGRSLTNRNSVLTIDDSVRLAETHGIWRTSPEGIVNLLTIKSDYDYIEKDFFTVDTFDDRASQVDTRVVSEFTIENKGIISTNLRGASDGALTEIRAMMSDRLKEYSHESFEYSCEVTRKADSLKLGDIVMITDAYVYNTMNGTIGITNQLGRVIRIEFDEINGSGTLTIRMSYEYDSGLSVNLSGDILWNVGTLAPALAMQQWEMASKAYVNTSLIQRSLLQSGALIKITDMSSGRQWSSSIKSLNSSTGLIEFYDELPDAMNASAGGELVVAHDNYSVIEAGSDTMDELKYVFMNGLYKIG
jgi:hypothetical protein